MITFHGHPSGDITFTSEEIETIQTTLKSMINGAIPEPSQGICYNLERHIGEWKLPSPEIRHYRLVSLLSMDWEHHRCGGRSHTAFPVPWTNYQWKGKGKTYRISLMKHILKKIHEKTVYINLGNWENERISLETLKDIQKEAKELLRKAKAGKLEFATAGICSLLTESTGRKHLYFIHHMVGIIGKRWPDSAHFGKYNSYPIPGTAYDKYEESPWTGKALEYRIDLLKYIIKRLKDTIRRAEKNGKATIK